MNAEKEGVQVAKQYKVNGFPTILFVDGAGRVESKIVGYLPPQAFAQKLTSIDEAHRQLPILEKRFSEDAKDATAAARLAVIYAGRDDSVKAESALAAAASADPDNKTGELGAAYNALGDCYQERQQFDKAIPLFHKAARTSKKPYDVAYARISAAVCYLSQGKNQAAIPELQACIAVKDGPKDLQDQAKQILAQVRKQPNR